MLTANTLNKFKRHFKCTDEEIKEAELLFRSEFKSGAEMLRTWKIGQWGYLNNDDFDPCSRETIASQAKKLGQRYAIIEHPNWSGWLIGRLS